MIMAKGYKKGSLLMEYFLNPHFKPTEKEMQELTKIFGVRPHEIK
jgi:hypothetical protein